MMSLGKNKIWIALYTLSVIIGFFLILLGGLVLGVCDFTAVIDILYEDNIFDLLLWPVLSFFLAIGELISGMLIANIATNIYLLREQSEK